MDGRYIGGLEMPSAATRGAPAESAEMLRRCPQIFFDSIFARAVHRQGMADIRYGLEVTGCDQSDNDVVCHLKRVSDGAMADVLASYVVACDGAASVVRKELGFHSKGRI
jgi:2-polyprenyl-6-methoxyphenol hydroxylase-like FAD-dependent oxidoreductase